VALETVSVPVGGINNHVTPGTFVPLTEALKFVVWPPVRDADEGVRVTII